MFEKTLKCPDGGVLNFPSEQYELMRFVAKALGGEISYGSSKRRTGETWDSWEWVGEPGVLVDGFVIHPLSNSGDALDVVVALKLELHATNNYVVCYAGGRASAQFSEPISLTSGGRAEIRRAITRAAAEVGRRIADV